MAARAGDWSVLIGFLGLVSGHQNMAAALLADDNN